MDTVSIKSINTVKPITDNYDRRQEARITLPVTLFLRRPINDFSYRHEVQTVNVSRHGVRIICNVRLDMGALLEVYGFDEKFSATAVVRNVKKRRDGRWLIGLKFIKKFGRWIVG
jgi:hypothetical protein